MKEVAEEKGAKLSLGGDLYRGDYPEEFYSDWRYPLRDELLANTLAL